MKSLKQQLLLLVLGPILLLSLLLTVVISIHMKERAILATETKAKSDLATGEAIIDLMYPGSWQVKNGELYKGEHKINNDLELVDYIASLTGDTVTIFLGDTRVATTVRGPDGQRALKTKVSDAVARTVLKNGQVYLGEANVVGEYYQTAYKPLRDSQGNIIGMFYVGISKRLSDQLLKESIFTVISISAGITLLVALAGWFFTQRVIIGPLQQITAGTMEVASGHQAVKVEVDSSNEIGQLAQAFNQMVEELQKLTQQISQQQGQPQLASKGAAEVDTPASLASVEESLPKGLNESTLKQILAYLTQQTEALSAEEIAEGVNLTRVTVKRYLDYLEKNGRIQVEVKYGAIGRPVKLYQIFEKG
ncbi:MULTISPECIES: cache domain-containing protein [Carboxydocella]|uniref:Methyl-accepting chemotaxis protein n=2 Tax=Carboxydocella TaxID=178898 RepID=A0A1T4N3T0_9FIRM|nr:MULTISPECIES: cache domain-containing protein [Carboxydocella]AVX20893.1 methyl-accepting chemotaxis protein [Carboxydocella thermautotrophica]AVX31308.1 methyl-accepting chemotaxis protein [Carboxydocella thermautotrophica]SJZ73508.1 methyl-accepting chemotaxis protein [Carboxydocella sporoproducens DSM 16521]GAW29945.1 hypothetical protein ULO1_25150 [Carboxydocella sp. ULO1]GAW30453.1 hypothetical protein JDF658_02180 [Carboxydocella sp. JDF658]